MNILKKLTKKDLKLNKKRTIGTFIGICLATALITAVGGMFFVLKNTLLQGTINSEGYYHIMLYNVPEEKIETIKLNKDFNHIEKVGFVGSFLSDDEHFFMDLKVMSMNKDTFDYLKYKIREGEFPKNDKEILISDYYSRFYGVKIGDTISLKLGNGYYFDSDKFVDTDYKVVGYISNYGNFVTNADATNYDVYLTLKNPKNYIKDFNELLGTTNFYKDATKNYDGFVINENILRWEVFNFSEKTLNTLYGIMGLIIGVILITSVFSIRNSFAISVSEKLKMYGMLSSVGATRKQIRKMVLLEGFYLGFVGITFGLILGNIVVYLLTVIVNKLALSADMFSEGWILYYKFSYIPSLIALLVGILMIYLSTLSSSIRASRVSPIQNIRNSGNIKNPKKLKVPSFIKNIFKIGGTLAYKNLKRSKKKYRVTVISLTVSILVFIVVSSFLDYGIRSAKKSVNVLNYTLEISDYVNYFKDSDIEKIASLDKSYLNYRLEYDEVPHIYDTSHILYKPLIFFECKNMDGDNCLDDNPYFTIPDIVLYDDNSFKEYAKMIKMEYDDIKDKAVIINSLEINNKNTIITDYKIGDEILLEKENGNSLKYNVGAVTDIMPWGMETYYGSSLILVLNKKYYSGDDKIILNHVYYDSKNTEKLEEELSKISTNFQIDNISKEVKQMKTTILIVSIFIYGFIIVITLIGVTSVFNTINSNMNLRKSEFASLKSIGMTKHEFNNMIMLESIFYSFKSLFFGIVLGIIGSHLTYKIFNNSFDFKYVFPLKPIIISCVFIIILVYTIMRYSISKVDKQNIIETIRSENI